MIKRVNSTGRKRISKDQVEIEVFDGSPRTFDALIRLDDFDSAKDAAVYLEATCAGSSLISRFPWGTVSQLSPPPERKLQGLEGENVFFSLKIIDRTERFGRILGYAENIRPLRGGKKTATGRRGILPVELSDGLGDELWKLDFRRTGDVFLLVNDRIPQLGDLVRTDPSVFALIYPTIIRQILEKAIDDRPETDEPDESWQTLWLRFGKQLHPEQAASPENGDDEESEEWIDEVVLAFCRQHALQEKFQRVLQAEGKWEDLG